MRKMNMGGSIPRQTTIQGQRHDLAYINPFEVDLLESYNATPGGVAGPGNVPAYPPGDGGFSPDGGGGYGGGGGFGGFGGSEGPGGGGGGYNNPAEAMAAADAAIAGQMAAAAQEEANAAAMAATAAAEQQATYNAAAKKSGVNNPNTSFDAFGNVYGTQKSAQAADVEAQAQAAAAGFQEGYGKPMKTDPISLIQKEMIADEEEAKSKKGLLGLIAKVGVKSKNAQRQAMIDDLTGKNKTSAFQGMLQKAGLTGTPTSFQPAFDKAGNLVGSAGLDAEGNVVSYSGDRNADLADGPVKDRVDAMNAASSPGGPGDGPDLPPIDMDPCPAGFVMDAATNVCVPVGVGGGDADGGVDEDDSVDPLPPYVPPSEVVGPPSYTPIGGLGSFVPTPLQPYPTQQRYQIMPQPMVTMMVGEEQG